ncbi:hypothetical protein JCM10369A_28160 [Nocardioides pyridinolyticus]
MLVVTSLCLVGAQAADASRPSDQTRSPVAHTKAGDLRSRLVGSTAAGRDVTGSFVPLKFLERNGRVLVRGLVQGVVHQRAGERTTFAQMKTVRVKSINGEPVRGRQAAGGLSCDILHLVLAPLDLDLLGLRVHLDRVVLDIDAVPGAGNLLGNLLCAVTHLLDGGLPGLLGRLIVLLNRILAILRLG